MRLFFKPLLSLNIQHQFYGDAPCPDFDFVIADHSSSVLAGHHLRARVENHQLTLYFEAADELLMGQHQPKQPLEQLELLIGLKLRNPSFDNFTENPPAQPMLYQNTLGNLDNGNSTLICASQAKLSSPIAERLLHLSLHQANNSPPVWQQTIYSTELPTLDWRSVSPGIYVLKQQSLNQQQQTSLVLAADLAQQNCWGVVKLILDRSFYFSNDPINQPAIPARLTIKFNARRQVFDYYVTAASDWNNFANNLSLSAVNDTVIFDKIEQADLPNDSLAPSLLGAPNKQLVLFRSQNSITRLAKASHQLQLKRNGTTLVKHLPQPGADMPQAHFIIHLTKP